MEYIALFFFGYAGLWFAVKHGVPAVVGTLAALALCWRQTLLIALLLLAWYGQMT